MYLNKKIYIGANYDHRNVVAQIEITKDGIKIPIDATKVSEIIESFMYWRKANQIHKWFVDNIQEGNDDCNDYNVDLSALIRLRDECKIVLDSLEGQELSMIKYIDDYSKKECTHMVYSDDAIAKELLPPLGGFFFGDYFIDENYKEDLQMTYDKLKNIEETENYIDTDYTYSSSR